MPTINVYVPGDLHARVRAAGIMPSKVCQDALRVALGEERPGEVSEVVAELDRVARTVRRIARKIEEDWQDGAEEEI